MNIVLFFVLSNGSFVINSVLFFVLFNGSFAINFVLFFVFVAIQFSFFAGSVGAIRIQIGIELLITITFPFSNIQSGVANTRFNFDHRPIFKTAMLINNTV